MLALEPAARKPRPDSLCCMKWETSMWLSLILKVLEVVKITYTLCAGSWNSLACRFPWEPWTGELRRTRTEQSLSQKEHFVACFLLATTGTDHFLRKLLRFHELNFFFHFHCVVRVKVVAFGSYIPSVLLLLSGSRDLFSVRWNTKALSPFGRTQLKRPVGKYFQMPCMTLLLKFLGWGNTSQQNNVLACYVHFAKLLSTFQRNHQSWCSDATERKKQTGDLCRSPVLRLCLCNTQKLNHV